LAADAGSNVLREFWPEIRRVFRTFGGFTESAGIGNRKWTDEREDPGCNHERHKSATPTIRQLGL